MAKSTPSARHKRLKPLLTVPPRNQLVPLSRLRKAGAHGKSQKAERRAAAVALRKGIDEGEG